MKASGLSSRSYASLLRPLKPAKLGVYFGVDQAVPQDRLPKTLLDAEVDFQARVVEGGSTVRAARSVASLHKRDDGVHCECPHGRSRP